MRLLEMSTTRTQAAMAVFPAASVCRLGLKALQLPQLLVLLCLLICHCQAIIWTQALQREMQLRDFGGIRLQPATPPNSVNITGVDTYQVQSSFLPGIDYSVVSRVTLHVIGQDSSSADGTYAFLRLYFVEAILWENVCQNTRNLTIYMGLSSWTEYNYTKYEPCYYVRDHAGVSTQQLTAWIVLTYSADWGPVWVNRTASHTDIDGAATVILASEASPLWNATWRNVFATGLLDNAAVSPAQRALALLASVLTSTSPPTNWWTLICSATNTTGNLLVSALSQGPAVNKTAEPLEMHMNCSEQSLGLTWGQPAPVDVASLSSSSRTAVAPVLESSSGGYWGPAMLRLVTTLAIGDVEFCNVSAGEAVQVTALDDIVVSQESATYVRSTTSFQIVSCSVNTSLALVDAYLKIVLPTEANWTEVCTDSIHPTVTVNWGNRTAVRFSPCQQTNASSVADAAASAAAKAAWCILALNTSGMGLQWSYRDANTLVDLSAASVTFSQLGGAENGTVLQWGNVVVNGLETTGDQVDRLVQVFQMTDPVYWPIICQLVNASVDAFLSIQVVGNSPGRAASLYANCSSGGGLFVFPTTDYSTAGTSTTEPPVTTESTDITTAPDPLTTTAPSTTTSTTTTTTPTTTSTTTTTTPTTTSTTTTTTPTTTSTTTTTTTPTTTSTTTTTTPTSTTSTTTTTPTTTSTTTTTTPTTTSTTTTTTPTTTSTTTTTTPTTTSTTTTTSTATTTSKASGTTTLSPEEEKAIIHQKNQQEVAEKKTKDELGTQIAVIMVALLVLIVLGTFGVCKMVLPGA